MWECSTIAKSPTLASRPRGLSRGWGGLAASPGRTPPTPVPPADEAIALDVADGDEVQCPIEILLLEFEVSARDRWGEAVVERLTQAQSLVDAIPAELQGQLVGAQLAGVEEPV